MMMSSTFSLNTPAANTNMEGCTQQRLPSCPPPPPRLSQEAGLIMMRQQEPNDLQSIPYFPPLSMPRVSHASQPHQQQRKRSFLDHTQEHHQRQLQQQFLRPRTESFDMIMHADDTMAANFARQTTGTAAAARVTPQSSFYDPPSADAEMMDIPSFNKMSVSSLSSDNSEHSHDRGSGAAKETKRRRRATLADEYIARPPTTTGRSAFGVVQKSRSSFPRAA